MAEIIKKYFPDIKEDVFLKYSVMKDIYQIWNSRINVISRKDFDNFYIHHVLHSLALARIIEFKPGTLILDAGTGGGFPGIPLAIMFPGAHFFLLDSIRKKINVVSAVVSELKLENVTFLNRRIEDEKGLYDFILSRAVTEFQAFVRMTLKNGRKGGDHILRNGILYLKGGDLTMELQAYAESVRIWEISSFFRESYFGTKKIVYLPF